MKIQAKIAAHSAFFRKKAVSFLWNKLVNQTTVINDFSTEPETLSDTEQVRHASDAHAIRLHEVSEDLKSTREQLSFLLQEMQVGVLLQGPKAEIVMSNEKALELLGLSEDQLLGLTSFSPEWNVIHEDGSPFPGETHPVPQSIDSRGPVLDVVMGVYRPITQDRVWLQVSAVPQLNADRNVIQVVCTFVDISCRKNAEQQLIEAKNKADENEERFRKYFEQDLIGFAITSPEKGWIEVNNAVCDYLGYTKEELFQKTWAELTHPDDLEADITQFNRILNGDISGYKLDKRFLHKNGSIIYTELSVRRENDPNGNLRYFLALINNITERKLIEFELLKSKEKAEESDRLKSAFLANMSHEIRTPMNGILGFSGLLKEANLSGDEQKLYIGLIEKSGARMLNIINDIVDISKIESGQMQLDIKDTNINEQLDDLYMFFKPEVELKGMKILMNNSLPSYQSVIKTDPEKVYAIVSNLIKNAIKYSTKGVIEFGYTLVETLHATSPLHATSLRFFVKDQGIGIPKERQEAIFERFIQADIADRNAYQGAGLGLAISKSYVEMLGGKIWVESQVEKGSSFYFTLPGNNAVDAKNTIKETFSVNTLKNPIRKLKILVVEDDRISEELISIYIKLFCKELLFARNGVEAVETCRNNLDIDLVLMDIQMPEMSGYVATSLIRNFNQEVIIIAQTAFGLLGDKEKVLEAGCNDYISKPVNFTRLKDLITRHFSEN